MASEMSLTVDELLSLLVEEIRVLRRLCVWVEGVGVGVGLSSVAINTCTLRINKHTATATETVLDTLTDI